MKRSSTIRCGLTLAGLLMGVGFRLPAQMSQSYPAKPSAAVSSLPVAQPTGVTNPTEDTPHASVAGHRVEVNYANGKLAVEATNASLNEILREVARKTGMKITGGVADDRVFGRYGPARPAIVLDALLEGMGSNMLLVDDAKGGSELILTPRHGGVTPPSPNAVQSNDSEDSNGGASQYVPPVRPFQPPVATGRGPINSSPDTQVIAPNSDSGDGNGPKTPQQIYDQLQRTMQQQKQAPNAIPQ